MSEERSSSNRRAAVRRSPKRSSKVLCVTGKFGFGPNVAVTLLDVSETGIRLVLSAPLAPGHEVEISLEAMGDQRPTKISGDVMWCVAMADGNHCLGIRFNKPLKWTLLTSLAYLAD
jgi:hypothetical protein